jgi:hypothetical protein
MSPPVFFWVSSGLRVAVVLGLGKVDDEDIVRIRVNESVRSVRSLRQIG